MKVHDYGLDKRLFYRYVVNIPRGYTIPIDIVENWLEENHIQCSLLPGFAFFRNYQDVVLFLLRWT
jgi:hypothetical protein